MRYGWLLLLLNLLQQLPMMVLRTTTNLLDQEHCYGISLLKKFQVCNFCSYWQQRKFLNSKISWYTVDTAMWWIFCSESQWPSIPLLSSAIGVAQQRSYCWTDCLIKEMECSKAIRAHGGVRYSWPAELASPATTQIFVFFAACWWTQK